MWVPVGMNVDVLVRLPAMAVLMDMDVVLKSLVQAPQTHPDEHDPDEAFGPLREGVNGKDLTEQKRQQPDYDDPTGVAHPPAEAGPPGGVPVMGGERSHGRQMVRPGEDMDGSRQETGKNRNHNVPGS